MKRKGGQGENDLLEYERKDAFVTSLKMGR